MSALSVQNLSKVYKLYGSKNDRLKEVINPLKKRYHHEFYALKDVTFTVQKGETIGIIGKNGSGKSTLLKIISGILSATAGSFKTSGKVSAILELGAGFNPEYTGIENVYLNGMIMGFTREEMNAKLDSIISFADIGNFIYQPVKMYSSGMYVRLAFAIAINVDPDILIVDEALAVGDIRFQQKCYRKINDFREQGKTILFCTHDTGAILNLCSSCIWIHDGQIKELGDPDEVVNKYQAFMYYDQNVNAGINTTTVHSPEAGSREIPWQSIKDCSFFGEGGAEITDVCFYTEETSKTISVLKGGEKVVLGIKATTSAIIKTPLLGFNVKNSYGIVAFGTNTCQEKSGMASLNTGQTIEVYFSFTFPPLSNGTYTVDLALADGTQENHIQHNWKYDVFSFKVENIGDKYLFGYIYIIPDKINCKVYN